MELTEGYKLTEIGTIPNDWAIKKFYEVTIAITCGVAATPIYVQESVGMPFLSASHVQSGRVVYNDYKFITKELYRQITKNNKPEKGDILYTRVGAGIGQAGVIDFDLDFAIYVSLTLIKLKPSMDSNFIKFILNSNYYQFLAKNGQFAGGGVQNLNVNIVREFPIPVPAKSEQIAISNALSDTDALIISLEKLIEKKRRIKQGVMQELLKPKEGWVMRNLGETGNCFAGGTPSTFNSLYWNGNIIWLPSGRVQNNILVKIDNEIRITKMGLEESSAKLIKSNSVLIAITGATCGNIGLLQFEATANQSVVAIEPNEQFDYLFLYYQLLNNRNIILSNQTGSAQGGINLKTIKNIEFYFPKNKSEQSDISVILYDMDVEIFSLEKKLSKSKMLKQGMMQELLTGKIRLI